MTELFELVNDASVRFGWASERIYKKITRKCLIITPGQYKISKLYQ